MESQKTAEVLFAKELIRAKAAAEGPSGYELIGTLTATAHGSA
jgi:hypothetical protein